MACGAVSRIPRIIHFMWLDKKEYDNEEPMVRQELYGNYIAGWKEKHPDFRFIFWNRRKVEDLWSQPEYAQWRPLYMKLQQHIEKCDLTRYIILQHYGGVYIDLDFQCHKPITPLLQRQILITYEPTEHGRELLFNGFLGSVPKHWLWPGFLNYIQRTYSGMDIAVDSTGPRAFGRYAKEINLEGFHPEYYIDNCLILPLVNASHASNLVSKPCTEKYGSEAAAMREAFAHTKWSEESFWGQGNSIGKLVSHQKNYIAIFLIILLIAIVAIIACWHYNRSANKLMPV
jgi:mannosyltransferase OCH1-like enzyme